MNKLALLGLLGVTLLAGCATSPTGRTFDPQRQTTVRTVVVQEEAPRQAPVDIPDSPKLKPVEFDYPRMMNASEVIKNTTACRAVPKEQQDVNFWAECGIAPIDPDSNIFIGMDQESYNNLTYNLATLKEYSGLLKSRLVLVNEGRK